MIASGESSTRRRGRVALAAYAVPTVGLFLQGVLYLATPRFMPYHAEALGVPWEELSAAHQQFLLGVIRAMGAGSITVTCALAVLILAPWRRRERWAMWTVPAVGVLFTALTAHAAYTIDAGTPAATPWRETLALTALYAAGGVLTLMDVPKSARNHGALRA